MRSFTGKMAEFFRIIRIAELIPFFKGIITHGFFNIERNLYSCPDAMAFGLVSIFLLFGFYYCRAFGVSFFCLPPLHYA